jgi:hypothetical protein
MNYTLNNNADAEVAARPSPLTGPQLELGFGGTSACRILNPRERRRSRATWWFQRMRQIVDCALDWQPAPPPRPEQTWFPGTHRQVRINS